MNIMTLSILVTLFLIDLSFGGTSCGSKKAGVPTLEIKTADVTNANYGGRLLATIRANDQWSTWRQLDNPNCDDFERGSIDYFDDFEDITAPWQAINIYNCETDGIAITGLSYWDGQSNENYIGYFCDNVASYGKNCYDGAVTDGKGTCYKGIDDNYYQRVWLDQNDRSCPAMNVAFGKTLAKDRKTNVGTVYYKSNPGIPKCSDFNFKSNSVFAVLQSNLSQTITFHMISFILIGIVVIYAIIKYIMNNRNSQHQKLADNETKYGTLNV